MSKKMLVQVLHWYYINKVAHQVDSLVCECSMFDQAVIVDLMYLNHDCSFRCIWFQLDLYYSLLGRCGQMLK